MNIDVTDNAKREKLDLDASGALDFAGKRGHMTEQITAADGTKKSLDLVLDGTSVYLSGPALAGKLRPAPETVADGPPLAALRHLYTLDNSGSHAAGV